MFRQVFVRSRITSIKNRLKQRFSVACVHQAEGRALKESEM